MRGRIWGGGYEREDLRRDEWQGATVLMMVLVCTGHRFRSTHSAAQWHSDPVTTISDNARVWREGARRVR